MIKPPPRFFTSRHHPTAITSYVIWVSGYQVYPWRCFQKDYEHIYYPALIAGIHPRFLSQAYLVSIRHSTFQVSGYRVYPWISEVSISSLPCISYFHLLFQHQEGGVLFFIACEGVSLLLTLFFICTLSCHIWTYLLLSFSLDYVSFLSLRYTPIQQSY